MSSLRSGRALLTLVAHLALLTPGLGSMPWLGSPLFLGGIAPLGSSGVAAPQAGTQPSSSQPKAKRADKAQIRDLLVLRDGRQLTVSFQLSNAFNRETLERIQSGLPTGFTYHLKLERRRAWWFDNRLQRSSLQVVAMYNAITREYLVNYKKDGELLDSRVVTSTEELRDALTIFHAWPAFELDDRPLDRLVLRLRADLGAKTILAFIPTTRRTDWAEHSLSSAGEPQNASF